MKCLLCGNINIQRINFSTLLPQKDSLICCDCLKKFEKVTGGCIRCGKKTSKKICDDCLYWEELMSKVVINHSLFYYNSYAKDIIRKIKFLGDILLLFAFNNIVKSFFKNLNYKNYIVVPIPLHYERFFERGFNQSLILARMTNLPIFDILYRKNNDKQSKKKKEQRLLLGEQFDFINHNINLFNKKIIIVDDIYTTGATIHEVVRLLLSKNVKNIISFTLFRS